MECVSVSGRGRHGWAVIRRLISPEGVDNGDDPKSVDIDVAVVDDEGEGGITAFFIIINDESVKKGL